MTNQEETWKLIAANTAIQAHKKVKNYSEFSKTIYAGIEESRAAFTVELPEKLVEMKYWIPDDGHIDGGVTVVEYEDLLEIINQL